MLINDISNISSNKFAILIRYITTSAKLLTTEFILNNNGDFPKTGGDFTITGTPLELIGIIKYMQSSNYIFTLCNIHGAELGRPDYVLEELSRKNRNLQIDEIIK